MSQLYLVYGWKVPVEVALTQITPEAAELGMKSVIHAKGKDAFIGDVRLSAPISEEEPASGVALPSRCVEDRLRMALSQIGLDRFEGEGPMMWMVIG